MTSWSRQPAASASEMTMTDIEQALAVRMAAAGARVEYEATRNRITLMPSSLAYFKMLLATDEGAAIARDAAVGRAVRRLEETGREWRIEARPMTYHIWTGVFGAPETIAPNIVSGVAAALGDDDD